MVFEKWAVFLPDSTSAPKEVSLFKVRFRLFIQASEGKLRLSQSEWPCSQALPGVLGYWCPPAIPMCMQESKTHGWPSFRDEEVVWDNVRIISGWGLDKLTGGGETVSVDGTHLGHNLPDLKGNRYPASFLPRLPACHALPRVPRVYPIPLVNPGPLGPSSTLLCTPAPGPCLLACAYLVLAFSSSLSVSWLSRDASP